MASGATGHRATIKLRRPATRTLRATSVDDRVDLTDTVSDAIGGVPELPFDEMAVVEFDFTSSLDVTMPHKLSGPYKFPIPCAPSASATFRTATVTNSQLADTHIRLIATGACIVKVLVCR